MRDELVKWRVQTRLSKKDGWVKRGLFETRKEARERAAEMRLVHNVYTYRGLDIGVRQVPGYGFGNTRVVCHEVKPRT